MHCICHQMQHFKTFFKKKKNIFQRNINTDISSVQSFSPVRLFETPQTVARQASLSITNSRSLLKLMSITSVVPSNHLILCHPLLLLPSIFPRIRVFSNESALRIRWPEYWSLCNILVGTKTTTCQDKYLLA